MTTGMIFPRDEEQANLRNDLPARQGLQDAFDVPREHILHLCRPSATAWLEANDMRQWHKNFSHGMPTTAASSLVLLLPWLFYEVFKMLGAGFRSALFSAKSVLLVDGVCEDNLARFDIGECHASLLIRPRLSKKDGLCPTWFLAV